MPGGSPFRVVQFEFPFGLGPADGRYLTRASRGAPAERVIVLRTVGAPRRRLIGARRPARVETAEPAPVPAARATVIDADPFGDEEEAGQWLSALRRDRERLDTEVETAAGAVSALLRAHRAAAADPYTREVVAPLANVVRVGYGAGELVADGRFSEAYEIPERHERRRRVDLLAPQERLAAILSGRAAVLVGEELVLRARTDLDAGRPREAALQARIALEALLAELPGEQLATALAGDREAVASAANAALAGDLSEQQLDAVVAAVGRMGAAVAQAARAPAND